MKVCPADIHVPLFISCVCYMWEAPNGDKMFHCRWLRYKTCIITVNNKLSVLTNGLTDRQMDRQIN